MTDVETAHELVLVKRYDASPEQIWAAWTDPEIFVQWWCPPDWTVPDDEARTVLTVQLRAVDGGTEQEFRQAGVITDEPFEALKAGTEMFFTRLGEFLAR